MQVLTASSLSAFRDCPRKYQYRYEMERAPVKEAGALTFGRAAHLALAAWWRDGLDAAASELQRNAESIPEQSQAQIMASLKHYAPPRDRYEVLDVERSFEVQIRSPYAGRAFYGYRLAGRVDLLLRERETGELWVADHKTTASEIVGFGTYWQALQIDGQMNAYCLAMGARGFIYDVLRKPTIKLCGKDEKAAQEKGCTPLAAYMERIEAAILEDPASCYQWREHIKTDADVTEAQRDLWQQVEMHRACALDSRFPRNPNACVGRYGTCEFLDVCTGRASIDDETLFRAKEAKHEELE